MGLSIGGHHRAACTAFDWMTRVQRKDGSWYAAYRNGMPEERLTGSVVPIDYKL